MKKFSDKIDGTEVAKTAVYAQKAWLILIGMASHRQTIRYADLAKLLGLTREKNGNIVGDSRLMGKILYYILCFCTQNEIPQLNDLVVNKEGRQGHKRRPDTASTEAVFAFDWYDIIPPSAKTLREAKCAEDE